ncbi:MAG: hypothetical protein GF331_14745 [Chitinivibrionales bacterium]|nr:hypothetical protein [Chitinivibrionales bacterium]
MVYVITIAVFLSSLLASLGIALGMRRARRRTALRLKHILEQRSLAELQEIREAIETSYPVPRSTTIAWYKRVRLVLSVYAHERFGVSVRDRINASMFEHLVQRYPDSWGEIRHLRSVFNKLTDAEERGRHLGDLARVLSATLDLLGERIASEEPPSPSKQQARKRTQPQAVVRPPR